MCIPSLQTLQKKHTVFTHAHHLFFKSVNATLIHLQLKLFRYMINDKRATLCESGQQFQTEDPLSPFPTQTKTKIIPEEKAQFPPQIVIEGSP